jgi:tetratricopeptide (TPR) repeat protein
LQRWNEAIEAHKQAINLKKDYAGAYFNLGFAYFQSGNKKAAMDQYKILQTMNPNLANQLYLIINKRNPPRQVA